jgi:hypothetical protein
LILARHHHSGGDADGGINPQKNISKSIKKLFTTIAIYSIL